MQTDTAATDTTAADSAAADAAATDTTAADSAAAETTSQETLLTGDGVADGDNADGGEAGDGGTDAPQSYADFELPEGIDVDANFLGEVSPVMQELGLNQEGAQKLVSLYAAQVQAGEEAQVESFNQMIDGWKTDSRNDKEFGGDKFDESISTARDAIKEFGTPELSKLLSDHGVGNHPEMVRFMVRVGALLKSDKPGETGGQTVDVKDHTSILYPNQ